MTVQTSLFEQTAAVTAAPGVPAGQADETTPRDEASPDAAVTVKPLTEKQAFMFELVRHAGQAGLPCDDVGAAWCAKNGKHPADDRCEWCASSGRSVLRSLRRKGHVKSRRDGTWYALHDVVEPEITIAPPPIRYRADGTVDDGIPF